MKVGGTSSRGEAGYSLVALLVTVTVMMVMMGAAVPSWRYLMQNDREEELLFRGSAIADAIERYQKKNGGTLPPTLEVLVKGRFLRKAYKDPMTKEGKWRLIRQGESLAAPPGSSDAPGGQGGRARNPASRLSGLTQATVGGQIGVFMGVATTNKDKSFRVFNGRTKYDEWLFVAGQPRVIGRQGIPSVISPQTGQRGTRPQPNR